MPYTSQRELEEAQQSLAEYYDPETGTLAREVQPDFDPTKDRPGLQAEITLWAGTPEGVAAIGEEVTRQLGENPVGAVDAYTKQQADDTFALKGQAEAIPDYTQAAGHLGRFLHSIATKQTPSRVLLQGTSISSFSNSALQVFAQHLQNQFGYGGRIDMLGAYGGTYDQFNDWRKQAFGGSGYVRLVLQPGNPAIVITGVAEKIILVYSKEANGGEFTVSVDGGAPVSATSQGVQAYNQELVIDVPDGFHTVTITAPSSGNAYLERLEWLLNRPGIVIENATLGGHGLGHMVNANTIIGNGNLAPITVQPGVGIAAYFNRSGVTQADVQLMQHFTNDGDAPLFSSILQQAVALTKARDTPFVVLDEMPALPFLNAAGVLNQTKQDMLAALRVAASNPHVSYISWLEMVDTSDMAAYQARYFPGSDNTHPSNEGHQLPLTALCSLFAVPALAHNDLGLAQNALFAEAERSEKQPARLPTIAGALENCTYTAQAVELGTQRLRPLYTTQREVNQIGVVDNSADNVTIAASVTRDEHGPYLSAAQWRAIVLPTIYQASGSDIYTVVLLVKRSAGGGRVNISSPADNLGPALVSAQTDTVALLKPQNNGGSTELRWLLNTADAAPVYVMTQYRRHSGADLRILELGVQNAQVYGAWVTRGTTAKITLLERRAPRLLGAPLPLTSLLSAAAVLEGQTYMEQSAGLMLEKIATNGFCQHSELIAPIFRFAGKSASSFYLLTPESATAAAYNELVAGQVFTINGNHVYQAILADGYQGKEFTVLVRLLSRVFGANIRLYNGGSNVFFTLQPDGNWTEGQAGGGWSGVDEAGQYARTFTFPNEAALGATPQFRLESNSLAPLSVYATLALGKTACI